MSSPSFNVFNSCFLTVSYLCISLVISMTFGKLWRSNTLPGKKKKSCYETSTNNSSTLRYKIFFSAFLIESSVHMETSSRDILKFHVSWVSLFLPFPKDPLNLFYNCIHPLQNWLRPGIQLVRSMKGNILLNQKIFLLLLFVGDLEVIINLIFPTSLWN